MTLLTPKENFISEAYDEFLNRYKGFGKELYSKIDEKIPDVFINLCFYHSQNFQIEDSYAEFIDNNNPFVIQLDPLIEVIVLWNKHSHIEIGTWSINEFDEAIDFIKSELL